MSPRPDQCGTPGPGQTLESKLDQLIDAGATEDAEAILEFATFMRAAGPPPGHPDFDPDRYRAGIAAHHDLAFGGPPPHPAGCPGCKET